MNGTYILERQLDSMPQRLDAAQMTILEVLNLG